MKKKLVKLNKLAKFFVLNFFIFLDSLSKENKKHNFFWSIDEKTSLTKIECRTVICFIISLDQFGLAFQLVHYFIKLCSSSCLCHAKIDALIPMNRPWWDVEMGHMGFVWLVAATNEGTYIILMNFDNSFPVMG